MKNDLYLLNMPLHILLNCQRVAQKAKLRHVGKKKCLGFYGLRAPTEQEVADGLYSSQSVLLQGSRSNDLCATSPEAVADCFRVVNQRALDMVPVVARVSDIRRFFCSISDLLIIDALVTEEDKADDKEAEERVEKALRQTQFDVIATYHLYGLRCEIQESGYVIFFHHDKRIGGFTHEDEFLIFEEFRKQGLGTKAIMARTHLPITAPHSPFVQSYGLYSEAGFQVKVKALQCLRKECGLAPAPQSEINALLQEGRDAMTALIARQAQKGQKP